MALIKNIILNNGITVNYHRVVSVNNITNGASIIEVASYTDKSKREEEKEKLSTGESMNIFIHTVYLYLEYNENLNVSSAYDYLKTLNDFNNAINDME